MAKQNKTANRAEYEHQYKLLRDRIRTAERAGFRFDKKLSIAKPSELKRVDPRAIEKLKSLRGETLRSKAKYVNPQTGKEVSGKKGVYLQRKQAGEKGYKTRIERKGTTEKQPIEIGKIEPSRITIEDVKAIQDPTERNKLWKEWFKQEHPDARSAEATVEEVNEAIEKSRDEYMEELDKRVSDAFGIGHDDSRKRYWEQHKKDIYEMYFQEDRTAVDTFLTSVYAVHRMSDKGEGYTYMVTQLNRAINNPSIGLHKVANAIREVMKTQDISYSAINYSVAVAVSTFNAIMEEINSPDYDPEELQDAVEQDEHGWDAIK